MAYIEQQDLLDATKGGLDIILKCYPQARDIITSGRKGFKIRDEEDASSRLKQLSDGNWVVTDFGDDAVPRNGIQVYMKEMNLSYREALVKLAGEYGVGGIKAQVNKPEIEKRPTLPEEKEGETYFEIKEEISDAELAVLGPLVTREVCAKYNVYSLISFTYIKNREAFITRSTDNYPIFMVDHGEFKKIYQPKNPEKQYRFRYTGTRPKDFVNGLSQVRKAYEDLMSDYNEQSDEHKKMHKPPKFGEIILASGERDSLNVAGMGYWVIWMNSETEIMSPKLYGELVKMADVIYNLPDIDETGKRQAYKLGLQYLDIKTIWLPEKLRDYSDHRGKPRKDFRDYVDLWPKIEDFKKLLRVAMPMRFWDEDISKGKPSYSINNVQLYYFLYANGFSQIEDKRDKTGAMFIHIKDNIVTKVQGQDCRDFVVKFLEDRLLSIDLRNVFHNSIRTGDTSLYGGLRKINLDFTDCSATEQYLFFENRTWRVTKDEISELKLANFDKYVWEKEVIRHKVLLKDNPFTIKYNAQDDEFEIEIHDASSMFMRFLINTSRVHWKTEFETRAEGNADINQEYFQNNRWTLTGPRLNDDEKYEQVQHFINKVFSIGYLLHRYKDPARPWCVFAMDNKITETSESHGRSGKSFCYKAIRFFMKSVTLNGKNQKLTDNPHVYDRVTEHTDYVLVDDADQYLNFGFFFNALQGDMEVNPKNSKSYEIPFEKVPKFCITSNYTLRNIDPSTEGRILYTVFSDYYHVYTEGEDYKNDFTIRDDFGKNLFLDYTEEEWNLDFNFLARCLQFYLSVPRERKINPPMQNVTKRNLRAEMTEPFKDWADVYFDQKEGSCNRLVPRDEAFKDFADKSGQHKWTTNKFTKALKAWCKYTDYVIALNPKTLQNAAGRIIRSNDSKAKEQIYIQTEKEIKTDDLIDNNNANDIKEEDKPF